MDKSFKLNRFREIVYKALVQKRLNMAWRSQGSSNEDLIQQLQGNDKLLTELWKFQPKSDRIDVKNIN